MKSFSDFVVEAAGGTKAGKIEVHKTKPEDAYGFAQQIYSQHNKNLDEEIPDFIMNYAVVFEHAKRTKGIKRKDMPVIAQHDLARFKEEVKTIGKVFEDQKPVSYLYPIQGQLYLDNVLHKMATQSKAESKNYLQGNIMIVDKSFNIIDGHHRYLSASLIDPYMKVNIIRINVDLKTLLEFSLHFSDNIAKNKRNK